MKCTIQLALLAILTVSALAGVAAAAEPQAKLNIDPAPIAADKSVRFDYDLVYVRSPRYVQDRDKQRPARWAEFAHIFNVNPGSDLMLLRPDGTEVVLVPGGEGAIQDPYVSFDGQWVYYTHFHKATDGPNAAGADVYKIHVPSRKIVRLTQQQFLPNRPGLQQRYGVYNMHPCPLPGGRVAFVSSRNGFLAPPKSYPQVALQLHVMDDDGSNVETIGHLNMAGALHPVILKDGRIIFSSLENMGLRNYILWGIWAIHPDGTNWEPFVSALHGHSSPSSWHFQTQLADENVVVELYYNQNQKGFGPLFKLPPRPPAGKAGFGPGDVSDPRNAGWMFTEPRGSVFTQRVGFRIPFTPTGMELLTPWIRTNDFPAWQVEAADQNSTRIGKLTHPCGAPDNHLLVAWTLGPIGGSAGATRDYMQPQPIDSGLYLIKNGGPANEPGAMLKIKNDPKYNEQWPRPLVSYKRVHGVDEPRQLVHRNDGSVSKSLPEGTPFGLVGTSSFYKRESIPMGRVEPGSVTATFPKNYRGQGGNAEDSEYLGTSWNWRGQGADAGRYENSDIHAVRIVMFEPNLSTGKTGRSGYPAYANHPMERLRILGEVPLRKFAARATPSPSTPALPPSPGTPGEGRGGGSSQGPSLTHDAQPLDPDNNPDTSFLAKIPADVPFTFQTIDKDGVALNMAQTWHQVRPGEVRNNCGGCHAHSQQPTDFKATAASRPDYKLFDLTEKTPLITAKSHDQSGNKWDTADATGIRYVAGPADVEYFRDIQPLLQRSCVACHTKSQAKPAGGLVLDDDATQIDNLPGTYFRLAADERARFSPRKVQVRKNKEKEELVVRDLFHSDMASHYVWQLQARRSLLAWKIHGRRLDGWSNDTMETKFIDPADPRRENAHVPRGDLAKDHRLYIGDIDFTGDAMPPKSAIDGTYKGPDGKTIKVPPLSDEEKRTIVRWIDLGCPIDLDPKYDPKKSSASEGYMSDDTRPTLTMTWPMPGNNDRLDRILIGQYDGQSGLDEKSFKVTADFALDGAKPGEDLTPKFRQRGATGVWELVLVRPIDALERGRLTVSVKDRRGNESTIERTFTVGRGKAVATK